jgi:hypothetical protein
LKNQSLENDNVDSNLYHFHDGQKIALFIIYVDDVYFTRNQFENFQRIKTKIKGEFEMINMGLLNHFTCWNFFSTKRHHNFQQGYVAKMFKEFRLGIYNVVMVFVMLVFKLTMGMGMLGANFKHYLGANFLRSTKILSQHHHVVFFT